MKYFLVGIGLTAVAVLIYQSMQKKAHAATITQHTGSIYTPPPIMITAPFQASE